MRLPNIGRVRLKETCTERGFEGRVLSATITRKADRWFASLTVEREREIVLPRPVEKPSDVVGVDLGLQSAAVIHARTETRVLEPRRAPQLAPASVKPASPKQEATARGRRRASRRSTAKAVQVRV